MSLRSMIEMRPGASISSDVDALSAKVVGEDAGLLHAPEALGDGLPRSRHLFQCSGP